MKTENHKTEVSEKPSREAMRLKGESNINDNIYDISGRKLTDPLCHEIKNVKPKTDKDELFFITYKKVKGNPKFTDHTDYVNIIKFLETKGQIIDIHYETDSDSRLHIHLIYECRKDPYRVLFNKPGYSFYMEPIYDVEGVHRYMSKQCANKIESSQLLDQVKSRNKII